MVCDQTRINNIENNLKNNPTEISNNDLIYYLQCNTNNNLLDSSNLQNACILSSAYFISSLHDILLLIFSGFLPFEV